MQLEMITIVNLVFYVIHFYYVYHGWGGGEVMLSDKTACKAMPVCHLKLAGEGSFSCRQHLQSALPSALPSAGR